MALSQTQTVITRKMILKLVAGMEDECPVFGILVIGETGNGKTTLVNNLLGKDNSSVQGGLESLTSTISSYPMEVEGVHIRVYDTPGLQDSRGKDHDAKHLKQMKDILNSGEIQLVIYCLKLTETRMHQGLIRTFQEYNKIGVIWEQTLIALTFADAVPVPKEERKKADFKLDQYFDTKVKEWQGKIVKTLVENVGIQRDKAEKIVVRPITDDPDANLPNGKEWYHPLRITILKLLPDGATMKFARMHAKKVNGSKAAEIIKILALKIATYAIVGGAVSGVAGGVVGGIAGGVVGGIVGGVVGGPLGIPVGALLGAGGTAALSSVIFGVIGTGVGALPALFHR